MSGVPGWLLRHRIGLAPWAGVWGSYGARVNDVPCAIQSRLSAGSGQPGTARVAQLTIITQLATPVGEGDLVYLPDGRVGYVGAVASHTAPGLPVPEHTEFAVEVGARPLPPALGGELVVILRRIRTGEDRYGNARYVLQEDEIPTAAVRPLTSTERDTGVRDQTVDTIEVIFPPGTVVTSNDRLRVRGLTYEVEGNPIVSADPMTGVIPGVKVTAKRVKG